MASCSSRSPLPAGVPLGAPPLTEAEIERFLTEAAAEARAVRRYQAVLGVRGDGPRGRFSGRMLVVFQRPEDGSDAAAVASLRMEAFAPVGGARWTLVASPGRANAVVPSERAFGEASDLAEFTLPLLGVPVGVEQVAALLVGTGVPLRSATAARPSADGGAVVLDQGEILWWDHGADAAQLRRVATPEYGAAYPDEWRRDGRQVPRRIEVFSTEVRAELTVEELRVNAELHPESFELRAPAEFRRLGVRELTGAMRLSGDGEASSPR